MKWLAILLALAGLGGQPTREASHSRPKCTTSKAVKKKASKAGFAPDYGMRHPAPEGRFVPKTTVHFGPNGGLWHDLPAFNAYVARCQSILQSGQPANDLLLYLPVHDLWHSPSDLLLTFPISGQWLHSSPFYDAATSLWKP